MIRRHSVCLSDIPYDYDYDYDYDFDYSSYESPDDDDANADPNDTITVYTLRRASSPVMTSSYNAGKAVNMDMSMTTPAPRMSSTATTILAGDAHGNGYGYGYGHGLPGASKKPKKKKPKKNKRSKTKDKKEDNSPEGVHSAVTVADIAESSTTTTTVGDNGGQGQPISAPLIVNGANWNWKQKQMSEVRPPSARTFTFIHFLHRIQANSPSRLATTSMMQTTVCSASSARTIPRCT